MNPTTQPANAEAKAVAKPVPEITKEIRVAPDVIEWANSLGVYWSMSFGNINLPITVIADLLNQIAELKARNSSSS